MKAVDQLLALAQLNSDLAVAHLDTAIEALGDMERHLNKVYQGLQEFKDWHETVLDGSKPPIADDGGKMNGGIYER